jgi:hypothetical protein
MTTQLLLQKGGHVTPRFLDWIWHIRGSLTLASGQSADEVMTRLVPLFRQTGTSHERTGDTLTFRKKDQAAQDKMSIFDGGVLRIERGPAGPLLRYHLTSRALLFCFLAPLLFLSFAGLTIVAGKLAKPPAQEAIKKDDRKDKALPQHWIDKALGAPAPEKPKKDDKSKEDGKKPKPTAAYVFAGLFAALYVVGRILEGRLVKSLFRKRLLG